MSSRQMRRAAERANLKNTPPTIGPRGIKLQQAAAEFQGAMQQVQVAEQLLTQWTRLKQELTEADHEDLGINDDIENKLKRRLQIARIAAIDAGVGLIGIPGDAADPIIHEATDADVAAVSAETLRQLDVEESR